MLIRALIVLLVFLNLGVAAWWLTRPPPDLPPPAQMQGVAVLELADVAPRPAQPEPALAPAPTVTSPPAAPTPAASTPPAEPIAVSTPAPASAPAADTAVQCLALGPFDDSVAARSAQARLVPAPRRASVRSETQPAKAYAVLLPPLADRAAAQAMVERITAAGFHDLLVINSGPFANGVALGRYGSREAAQRRQAELQAGGFAAQIQPVGQTVRWWLDVSLGAGEAALARRQTQAARAVPRDCG
ncbi:SPOR domain-containing protein [Pseudoxanthomonas spadix]|uniref:SPOR domain-containing protein n=1 Tax=Pseudoxanthomonas spadix TaxID=415229 RepID=UPI000EFF7CA4|nr:SPOR domain-containing protein [Pseudoxanthomonas spadix]MBP3975740.1 SPOR domain-containing protein [Pseudoxanthomonas spadix]RMW91949.1 SPOR domain-containing protein [Pseudoxanthomonas spadix]